MKQATFASLAFQQKKKQTRRERFLTEEWPLVLERIQRLGLEIEELLDPKRKWGPK